MSTMSATRFENSVAVNTKQPHALSVPGTEKIISKNQSLDRESKGCYSVLQYTSVFIFLDVWRQIASYGMIYFNENYYPVAPTEIVAIAETIKLVIFLWQLLREGTLMRIKISLLYFIPSFIYALNSNIYFFAMRYTTPPVWNLLTQLRVIFMALIYRSVFGRTLSWLQWVALLILTIAVILPQFDEFSGKADLGDQRSPVIAVTMGIVASILAALGPLYTEFLFKNDDRSFTDMQMQLYLFGAVSASFLYVIEANTTGIKPQIAENANLVGVLVVLCTMFTAAQGVSTAYIMKRLDNIVKLYAQSISNILMTIACTIFFPRNFSLEYVFVASFILTIVAIVLYEHANLNWEGCIAGWKVCTNRLPKSFCGQCLLTVGAVLSVLMLVFLYLMSQSYGVLSPDSAQQSQVAKGIERMVIRSLAQGHKKAKHKAS